MITSKEQERKALEQIEKILSSLGEDSYVATAFEGCAEIAKENIEDDFACSMKQRYESAKESASHFKSMYNDSESKAKELKKTVKEKEDETWMLQNTISDLKKQLDEARKNVFDLECYKAMSELRKDVTVETISGDTKCTSFDKIQYTNSDGFKFVTIVEKNGWTTSYRIDDLKVFNIE